jgi:DNA-binding transcriptional LysR family regulator
MAPDLRQLRYFVAVAEELNMTRAAERVFLTQPALSQQIQKIEAALGVRLLDRNTKGVTLTEPGQIMLEHARKMLHTNEVMVRHVRQSAGIIDDKLRLAYSESSNLPFIPPALKAIRQQFPTLKLERSELTPEQQQTALLEGRLDVGIMTLRADTTANELRQLALLTTQWVVELPHDHPLASQPEIPLRALNGETLITVAETLNPKLFAWFLQCCQNAGFRANIAFEVGHSLSAVRLVEQGLGLFVACSSTAVNLQSGVVARPLIGFESESTIGAVWHPANRSRVLQGFLEILKDTTNY